MMRTFFKSAAALVLASAANVNATGVAVGAGAVESSALATSAGATTFVERQCGTEYINLVQQAVQSYVLEKQQGLPAIPEEAAGSFLETTGSSQEDAEPVSSTRRNGGQLRRAFLGRARRATRGVTSGAASLALGATILASQATCAQAGPVAFGLCVASCGPLWWSGPAYAGCVALCISMAPAPTP